MLCASLCDVLLQLTVPESGRIPKATGCQSKRTMWEFPEKPGLPDPFSLTSPDILRQRLPADSSTVTSLRQV